MDFSGQQPTTTEKILVRHLYKIFGPRPQKVFELLDHGLDKDEIFTRTGNTLAVSDANLSINSGEIFVIMGLSGSGKSTLVRMLNRLIEPTSGEIYINGQNILSMDRDELIRLRRNAVAMVFQSFALLPHLTVYENTAFGLQIAGKTETQQRNRALYALEQVGLTAYAESYPDELSGGMQQRVGLARALATNPDILLMDEAFSALDPLIRREMQEELLRLQDQQERTVVFISHDLDEAMRIGDRIAIMEVGSVLQTGTPREILDNPASDYVQSFFRDVDLSHVYTVGDVAEAGMPLLYLEESGQSPGSYADMLASRQQSYGYVINHRNQFIGIVSRDSLTRSNVKNLEDALLEDITKLRSGTRLAEALGSVAVATYPVPVIGKKQQLLGTLSRARLLSVLERPAETETT